MTVYDLIRELTDYSPDADVSFKAVIDDESGCRDVDLSLADIQVKKRFHNSDDIEFVFE